MPKWFLLLPLTSATFIGLLFFISHSATKDRALRLESKSIYENRKIEEQKQKATEKARLQALVKEHIDFLSSNLFNSQGELNGKPNQRISQELTVKTVMFLRTQNLDGEHKGQIVDFLSQVSQVNLPGADLSTAELKGLALVNASFQSSNLSNAEIVRANLSGANLINADMSGANLSNAKLFNSNLRDANLSKTNLSNTNLSSANLSGTNLSQVNLNSANLNQANLTGANLAGTSLKGVNFENVDLRSANLQDTNIHGVVNLHAATLCKTQLPPSSTLDSDRDCNSFD